MKKNNCQKCEHNCPKCDEKIVKHHIHDIYFCENNKCSKFFIEFCKNFEICFSTNLHINNYLGPSNYYFNVRVKDNKIAIDYSFNEEIDIIANYIDCNILDNEKAPNSIEDVIKCYKIIDNYIIKFINNLVFM